MSGVSKYRKIVDAVKYRWCSRVGHDRFELYLKESRHSVGWVCVRCGDHWASKDYRWEAASK